MKYQVLKKRSKFVLGSFHGPGSELLHPYHTMILMWVARFSIISLVIINEIKVTNYWKAKTFNTLWQRRPTNGRFFETVKKSLYVEIIHVRRLGYLWIYQPASCRVLSNSVHPTSSENRTKNVIQSAAIFNLRNNRNKMWGWVTRFIGQSRPRLPWKRKKSVRYRRTDRQIGSFRLL